MTPLLTAGAIPVSHSSSMSDQPFAVGDLGLPVGFVGLNGNLPPSGERFPTLGQLQALAELARHGSFKDAAYCLGATHGTTRNQAYFGFHRLGVTTSTEAFGVMGWLTVPRALLGCE